MPFRLKTFGGLSLTGESGAVTGAATQRRKLALLAVLATGGERGVSRDRLLALFWSESDAEHARHALTQSLSALRRELGSDNLFLGSADLSLNPAVIESDVAALETALARAELERAAALYVGPFLDGIHLDHAHASPEFERWVEAERSRLAGLIANALERLAVAATELREHRRAVEWWRRLAALDPCSARSAAGLITALAAAGDASGALRHAQVYQTLLREELNLDPDEAVVAIVRRLRHGTKLTPTPPAHPGDDAAQAPAARGDEAPAVEPSTSPRLLVSRRRWLPLGVGLATVAALGGGALLTRSHARPVLDPNLVAVAPFDVLDPRFELWHEGLVDYLSKSFDGAGPLRTVSPTVLLRRWHGPADPTSASELGRRTGAHLVLSGQVVGEGADSARVRVTVVDAATGNALAELERTDLATRLDRLADSLAADVLRDMGRIGPEAHIRLSSLGTQSWPALKAFLRGEQLLRRFSLDSAIRAYQEAVADDGRFALALRRLGLVRGWRGENGDPLGLEAGRFNRGLAPRDSLLIVADSLEAASDDSLDGAYWSHRVRKFIPLEEAIRRYPDDPEVWYELGEARFHLGYVMGSTAQQAIDAFSQAIGLDAAFAPAYVHPVQLSLDRNDTTAAQHYINGYIGLTADVAEGQGIRLVRELIDPIRAKSSRLQSVLDTASANVLFDAWRSVQRWPDVNETGVRLLRILVAGRRGIGVAADTMWTRYLLVTELLYRGHLREARAMAGARFSVPFAELAVIGVIPPDSAAAAFDAWLMHPGDRAAAADPPWVGRCYRSFLASGWWAGKQDTVSLVKLMRRGDSTARSPRSVVQLLDARADASLARAALALARRDTAEALQRFLAFPDSLCARFYGSLSPSLAPLSMERFSLLAATGRDREAARVFDQQVTMPLTASSVWGTLERGQIAERLGDLATAARDYEFVVAVWRNADPELQPYVTEARVALQHLGATPSRAVNATPRLPAPSSSARDP